MESTSGAIPVGFGYRLHQPGTPAAERRIQVVLPLFNRSIAMPNFQIVPERTQPYLRTRNFADAYEIVDAISTLREGRVHVERDGEYAFSVQVSSAGVWQIFSRNRAHCG